MVSCEFIDSIFSAATITLIGLVIDGTGAIVISGFSLQTVNKLGRKLWPPYRKISSAWNRLHDDGEVSRGDYGFDELADLIGSKQRVVDDENLKLDASDVVFSTIQYSDDENEPYTDNSEIQIILREADHIEDTFTFTHTTRMKRETAISLINNRIERGFLKTGAVLLGIGFGFQIYAQLSRIFTLNVFSC